MFQEATPPNKFIDTMSIGSKLLCFAIEAQANKVATIDIIIMPERLAWRDHNKPHGYRPAICTLETQYIIHGLTLYTAHNTHTRIEAALAIHNANLET